MTDAPEVVVDGVALDVGAYRRMHARRIDDTIALLRRHGARRVVELGAHPWVMTAALIEAPGLQLLATVSAEEATLWPDDIEFSKQNHELVTPGGCRASIPNYSLNVERRLAAIDESPDAVLACEIVEHLVRAPHVMFLNVNRWLGPGGLVVVTTPNGTQLMNPFRRRPRMPGLRAHCYERHSYVYRLADLVDLIELCGFEIVESGFWSPYPVSGVRRLIPALARLPGRYFPEKFARTLFVVARKARAVGELPRAPRMYAPSPAWEHIAAPRIGVPRPPSASVAREAS